MPLRSMTGYGTVSRTWSSPTGPMRVEVEIRSVNARFLELKLRQPFGPRVEQSLRRRVEQRLGRGRVELTLSSRRETTSDRAGVLGAFGFDDAQVRAALALLAEVQHLASEEKLELRVPTSVEILRFLQGGARGGPEALPTVPPFVEALTDAAVEALCGFRAREGEALHAALESLVSTLDAQVDAIEATLEGEQKRLTERWVARVSEVCERAAVTAPVAPERVVQEVAMLVSRGDVAEELARIRSHLEQLRDVLGADPSAGQGKTLDFLSQELLREITTIGSKITSHEGSRIVIDAKGTIERVREQVQNVE